jgi:hypothetical protein
MSGDKKCFVSGIAALCLAASCQSAFCQSYVELLSPGGAPVFPVSINAVGAITGYFQDPPTSDFRDGFVRDAGGTVTTIRVPNFFFFLTQPSSINDVGAITGNYVRDLLLDNSGFVRDPQGNITSFDPPGSLSTTPSSINAGGVITGYYVLNGTHGFLRYADGSIISFDLPGSTSTMALGIIRMATSQGTTGMQTRWCTAL